MEIYKINKTHVTPTILQLSKDCFSQDFFLAEYFYIYITWIR